MSKLTVLDLFSGIGGFSLGLERSGGFETKAFCEIDEPCRKVLHKHWPGVLKFKNIKDLRQKEGDYDVVCGGWPCQGNSVAGKKLGSKDERSGLWKEYSRIIKEVKPRYVIAENVPNIRNTQLAEVIKDFWSLGYDIEGHIISARAIGAPHLRERLWIIAYPNSSELWEQPGGWIWESGEGKEKFRSFGKRGEVETTNANGNLRLWKPFTSKEEKSKWWAATTLGLNHWAKVKPPICGVDDGLSRKLDGARRERIKQLGNAVIPQIPEIIGKSIMDYETNKIAKEDN